MKKLTRFLLLLCLTLVMFMGVISWLTGSDLLSVWLMDTVQKLSVLVMPYLILFGGFYILIRSLFS